MSRAIGTGVILLSVASFAFAGINLVPEIDASSGVAALGLLGGAVLILRARRKK